MEHDLLHMPQNIEKRRHKLRRTVPAPNSYYIKVKCTVCQIDKTTFSHGQSIVKCEKCNKVLCKPAGGKLRIINKSEVSIVGKTSHRHHKVEKKN